METSGFFTAKLTNGFYDRTYLAEQFAQYFARFISNGVFMNLASNALMIEALPDEGMKVKVNAGEAFIDGYWYKNNDIIKKSVTPADGVLKRIDTVVLRYCNEERTIVSDIVTGTPSNNPVMTEPVRNSDYYELVLAKINIPQGATNIKSEYIVDLRLDSNYCGSVAALVEQIDTTEYGAQLNNFIEAYIQRSEEKFAGWEQTFGEWFDELKQRLDENAVTHLQQQLDDTIVEFNAVKTEFQGLENSTSEKHDDLVKKFNSLGEKFNTLSTSFEEVKKSVGDSKSKLAAAITAKKIPTASDDDFSTMIENIGKIKLGQGNAVEGQVLKNATFTNADGVLRTGSMPDNSSNAVYTSQTSGTVKYSNGSVELLPKADVDVAPSVTLPSGYYPSPVTIGVKSFEDLTNMWEDTLEETTNDYSEYMTINMRAYVNGRFVRGSIQNVSENSFDFYGYYDDFSKELLAKQKRVFSSRAWKSWIKGESHSTDLDYVMMTILGNGRLYRKGSYLLLPVSELFRTAEEANIESDTTIRDKMRNNSLCPVLMHRETISGSAKQGHTEVIHMGLKRIDMIVIQLYVASESTLIPKCVIFSGIAFGMSMSQVVFRSGTSSGSRLDVTDDMTKNQSIMGCIRGITGGDITLSYTSGAEVDIVAIQFP